MNSNPSNQPVYTLRGAFHDFEWEKLARFIKGGKFVLFFDVWLVINMNSPCTFRCNLTPFNSSYLDSAINFRGDAADDSANLNLELRDCIRPSRFLD